jgi:hypothetical protein
VALEWDERVEALLARRGVASTRCHWLLTPSVPVGSPRIAHHNPIKSVCWH